jgi:hypothetical protein
MSLFKRGSVKERIKQFEESKTAGVDRAGEGTEGSGRLAQPHSDPLRADPKVPTAAPALAAVTTAVVSHASLLPGARPAFVLNVRPQTAVASSPGRQAGAAKLAPAPAAPAPAVPPSTGGSFPTAGVPAYATPVRKWAPVATSRPMSSLPAPRPVVPQAWMVPAAMAASSAASTAAGIPAADPGSSSLAGAGAKATSLWAAMNSGTAAGAPTAVASPAATPVAAGASTRPTLSSVTTAAASPTPAALAATMAVAPAATALAAAAPAAAAPAAVAPAAAAPAVAAPAAAAPAAVAPAAAAPAVAAPAAAAPSTTVAAQEAILTDLLAFLVGHANARTFPGYNDLLPHLEELCVTFEGWRAADEGKLLLDLAGVAEADCKKLATLITMEARKGTHPRFTSGPLVRNLAVT